MSAHIALSAYFEPTDNGQRVIGAVRFETAGALADRLPMLAPSPRFFDWSSVSAVDSSAVALLLAARRQFPEATHQNLPPALRSLVELYGIEAVVADA